MTDESVGERYVVTLTADQLHVLVLIMDNADIKGRAAALVVSIQRALAEAMPRPSDPDAQRAPA